jgi:hypothetical protein
MGYDIRSRGKGKIVSNRRRRRTFKRKRVLLATLAIITILFVSYISVTYYYGPSKTITTTIAAPSKPRAAIIDSLYVLDNNSEFYKEANETLSNAGYKVDVILGDNVTVESFENITGYRIIVLRAHTAFEGDLLVFFTGTGVNDPNKDGRYIFERTVGWVRIGGVDGQFFFAVTHSMIEEDSGMARFKNTTVIVDSCYGLSSDSMAQAFIGRGASEYIAWDKGVYPQYSDNATLTLLSLISSRVPIGQAISEVPKEPDFGSVLSSYP